MKIRYSIILLLICSCIDNKRPTADIKINIKNLTLEDSIDINNDTLSGSVYDKESCNSDSQYLIVESIKKKFEYKLFNKNKIQDKAQFVLDDSTIVELGENENCFYKTQSKMPSPYSFSSIYFKTTKSLKTEGLYFYNFPIGVHKNFDSKGKLIDSIDYDIYFQFPVDSLIEKIKKEFNVDISVKNRLVKVSRLTEPVPKYVVRFPANIQGEYDGRTKVIVINGVTGKIIEQRVNGFSK